MAPKAPKGHSVLNRVKGVFKPAHPSLISEVEDRAKHSIRGSIGSQGRCGHPTDSEISPTQGAQSVDRTHISENGYDAQTHLKPDTRRIGAGDNDGPLVKEAITQPVTHSMFQGGSGHVFNNPTFIQNNGWRDGGPANDILGQLPSNNFRSIHKDTIERATAQTGLWFLDSEEFHGWTDTEGGMLWGIGIPGAGKTFLSSIVVNHLEGHADPGTSIAFVYCRYFEEITLGEVLTALVRQQLERDPALADAIRPTLARHSRENTKPSPSDLLSILNDIAGRSNRTFYIIDALDELPKDVCSKLLQALASVNASIFLTSRPLESMKAFAPNARYVDIAAHPQDIELFVAEKIASNPDFSTLLDENGVRDEVVASIIEKCAGRFLHASLQVETLRHCCSLAELEETMDQLPDGVEELYKADLKRIKSQPKRRATLATQALSWIINVKRSINFEELQCALSFSEKTKIFNPKDTITEALLLSICCGLITVEKESRLIRLVHFTAKEVLQPLLAHEYPAPDAFIADACISRLISCDFQTSTTITCEEALLASYSKNPLLKYAHYFWAAHTLRCDPSTEVRKRAAEFVKQCHSFPSALERGVPRYRLDKFNALHVAANYDFVDVDYESLLTHQRGHKGEHCNVNTQTPQGCTALTMACATGSTSAVRCLLDIDGIGVNLPDVHLTALIAASRNGHQEIVQILVGVTGIDPNLRISRIGDTALICASKSGHQGVVQALVGVAGIDVNLADRDGMTALIWASNKGHSHIVQMLLAVVDINVNLADVHGRTPLVHASMIGHEAIVKTLLGVANIDANLADKHGWTPLIHASTYALAGILRILLSIPGIDINFISGTGKTALMYASEHGHEGIVQTLVGVAGTDANFANIHGHTALMWASSRGREGVVRTLLGVAGLDANHPDAYGWTPLIHASMNGHEGVVKMLSAAVGTDANLADTIRQAALTHASDNSNEGV